MESITLSGFLGPGGRTDCILVCLKSPIVLSIHTDPWIYDLNFHFAVRVVSCVSLCTYTLAVMEAMLLDSALYPRALEHPNFIFKKSQKQKPPLFGLTTAHINRSLPCLPSAHTWSSHRGTPF